MKNHPCSQHHNGLWLSIYGKVYDVTDFVHPGGERILHSYCGMDCTVAWESVRHHKSQSLNAKLDTLLKGQLMTPNFPHFPLLQLNSDNATDLNGIFRACRKLMFNIVEIENATMMEYSLDKLHIAGEANEKDLTPMKIQMLFQTHRRFVFSHLLESLTNGIAETARFQNALRCPTSGDLGDDFFQKAPSIGTYSPPDNEIQRFPGYAKMVAACDGFVKASHQIDGIDSLGRSGTDLMGYLINCVYAMKANDLNLISNCKEAMKMLIVYFEERDSQELSLLNLYYEIQRVTDIMKLDMKYYVEKCASELVIGRLWKIMNISPGELVPIGAPSISIMNSSQGRGQTR